MIYKFTELLLFKDGNFSIKEKRVCVKSVGFNVKVYWSQRVSSQFYSIKISIIA